MLCVLSIILYSVNKVIFMRLEVLSHIVIKFTIGLFMLARSLYHIVIFGTYTSRLEAYLESTGVLDNEILQSIAPLFPFIEFALGLMLLLEVYYKEIIMMTVLMFCFVTVVYFFSGYQIGSSFLMLIFSLLSIWLLVNRTNLDKYKSLNYL